MGDHDVGGSFGSGYTADIGLDVGESIVCTFTNVLNEAPVLVASTFASVDENTTENVDLDASDDVDPEGDGLSYFLIGGDDIGLFDLDVTTGESSFATAPNFEAPGDIDADNVYDVEAQVVDSVGLDTTLTIAVTVLDVSKPCRSAS